MISRRALLASAAGVAGGAAIGAESGGRSFRRGVAVDSLLYWGMLRPGDPAHYADRPFAGPSHGLDDRLLANVVAAGFDFIRLTVDPGPFLDLEGAAREGLDHALLATVGRLRRAGLAVLVDLHPNTQVPAYDPVNWLTSTANPVFVRYLELVRRCARLLGGLADGGVAFELMNEPPYGYDRSSVSRWQSMAETLFGGARSEAPRMTLVVSGARGGNAAGLIELDPAPFHDGPVLFSFHYYEPHVFTHEGVPSDGDGTRSWRYLSALPYPPNRMRRATVLATVADNIEHDVPLGTPGRSEALRDAQRAAARYLDSDVGPRRVAADFDVVADWARTHGVPSTAILLGEFGVTRTYGRYRAADPVSRAAWLHDVRTAAEQRGFGWSLWELTGSGGMAIVREDGAADLDRPTLGALGLKGAR